MNQEPVRLSRWVSIHKRGNVYALFHSLCLTLIFLEDRYLSLLNELRYGTTVENLLKSYSDATEIIDGLISEAMVVPVSFDDQRVLFEKRDAYVGAPSLETIFLLLTDVCNLRCKYCFINENMPQGCIGTKTMTFEIAKEAIDMYFANLQPTRFHKTIVFYGGEPLLAFALLRKIVEYIETVHRADWEKYKIGLILISNGTLVNDEIAKYLAEHPEITICISLDGSEDVHDQKRVYSFGRGTYHDVMVGIEKLHLVGRKDVNISTTIDEHNINSLDELLRLHEMYHFQTVNFNLLLDTAEKVVDSTYTEEATRRMLVYFEKAREVGLHEDRIMRKVRAISHRVLHPFDCRATGGQLAISPDGSVGICHEGVGCKNFFFGRVSRQFVFSENAIVKEWGKRSPLTMPQCYDCASLGLCGGGCAYSAFLRHGTIWGLDDKFCRHSLTVLDWLIWDVYKSM